MRWRLEYEIDFDEGDDLDTPQAVAKEVFRILRDQQAFAPYFTVVNLDTGERTDVDLEHSE